MRAWVVALGEEYTIITKNIYIYKHGRRSLYVFVAVVG